MIYPSAVAPDFHIAIDGIARPFRFDDDATHRFETLVGISPLAAARLIEQNLHENREFIYVLIWCGLSDHDRSAVTPDDLFEQLGVYEIIGAIGHVSPPDYTLSAGLN